MQWKIYRHWADNIEVTHCKIAWHWGWRLKSSWIIHFRSFMLWDKSDHKKCGFVLVLHLFLSNQKKVIPLLVISNQKKVIPLSCHVQASFVPLNCNRFILKRNAKFLEFWFTYRSNQINFLNCMAVPLNWFRINKKILFWSQGSFYTPRFGLR